ncbi:MAG TPA: hypothetical protein VFO75_01635 [Candidatus Dormibacteraeota bacterium]|nr:hypothetical protein [Candidatus Dormibacteraeota bacterium]
MPRAAPEVSLTDQLEKVPPRVRPIVKAALGSVRKAAPKSVEEVLYRSSPPRSRSAMWKLVRFTAGGADVIGVGTFPAHATIWFYRGRELDDGSVLLQGSGKDSRFISLRSVADAEKPELRALVRKAFKLGGT